MLVVWQCQQARCLTVWCGTLCLAGVDVVLCVWHVLMWYFVSGRCWCCPLCLAGVDVVLCVWQVLMLYFVSDRCSKYHIARHKVPHQPFILNSYQYFTSNKYTLIRSKYEVELYLLNVTTATENGAFTYLWPECWMDYVDSREIVSVSAIYKTA